MKTPIKTGTSKLDSEFDVVIVGAGAAGLMCAAIASARGRKVLLLEGSNKPGKKILMSGGGRCNFTNLNCGPEHFTSLNPHFCKSALKRYSPWEFLGLVEKHDIPWVEKAAGQLFCQRSSKDILQMLLKECTDATLLVDAGITSIDRDSHWRVESEVGRFRAESLVIASGGLSIPKMGASGFGYEIARQFDLPMVDTSAGLVPLTFTGSMQEMTARLSGISVHASVATDQRSFLDELLFTHRGLSGPAALQISSFWKPGQSLEVALAADVDFFERFVAAQQATPHAVLRTILGSVLPRALALDLETLLFSNYRDTPIIQLGQKTLRAIADQLHAWTLKPAATEGYRTAEVTLGGVATDALSSQTMECKTVPGLYFIGEVMDVTGQLGGFNFQWAWASGKAAGEVV